MSNIFLDSLKSEMIKKDDYISLNSSNDLIRMTYSDKSHDIPLNNKSEKDIYETNTFINYKENFDNNNSRINELNEEIRDLKSKCKDLYEKNEIIYSLRKECQTLKNSLNDYEKYKEENIFLNKELKNFKNEIINLKGKITVLQDNLNKCQNSKKDKKKEKIKKEKIKEDKIDIDVDKIKIILSNRLKYTHEKHIDELIKEYKLDDCEKIDKIIMEELLYKAIHL